MATSLATAEYFMKSLLASNPWDIDPTAVPIPWREDLATPPKDRKLRLGVVFDDGVVKPQPPVARAMRETVRALRAAGHEGTNPLEIYASPVARYYDTDAATEVIEWDTSLHGAATTLWTKAVLADGGRHCRKLCEIVDEPLIEGMVVGTEKDLLTFEEREKVTIPQTDPHSQLNPYHAGRSTLTANSSKSKNTPSKQPSSNNGKTPASTRSSCLSFHG